MFDVYVVIPANRVFYQDQLHEMFRQRYRVFIEIFGWNLPHVDHANRLESNQFDND